MKKILLRVSAFALMFAGVLFTSCDGLVEGDTNFATTTIGSPSVSANAYPGVNVLTWKAIKDASSYTVYRTVGSGNIEEAGVTSSNVYYVDKDIDEGTAYKYRVVANPSDQTVHDASQTEVSLTTAKTATGTNVKGTWAPEGTVFSDLAQYETNYNANDTVLSEDTISAKLVKSTGSSVRVTFPTKPYALYTIYLSQVNGVLTNTSSLCETSTKVYGYNYNGSASVTLDAVYSGVKQVTVVATPLNNTLYGKSQIASSTTVEVKALDSISAAVNGSVSAKWTNYNTYTKIATARVYFSPYVYDGEEFTTDEYTIFRAVYTTDEETSSTLTNSDGTALRIYDSITNLGSPSKDTTVTPNGDTVYYLDDDNIDLSAKNNVTGVRYYVVLNHNGYLKTNSSRIIVPSSSDSDWNFTPDSASSSEYTTSVSIKDIYIDTNGIAYVGVSGKDEISGTYGIFDTLNEAKVAVESELPTALTKSSSSDDSYYYTDMFTTGTATVDTSKYYAFRVLSTRYTNYKWNEETQQSEGVDPVYDVATTIAKPFKVGGAYYWSIQTTYPDNYVEVGATSLSLDSDVGTTTYNSVDLTYYASNAKYYNIYRYINSYNSSSLFNYSADCLTTTTNVSYEDSSVKGKRVSESYIFYKVISVGYYGVTESLIYKASRLATPAISVSGTGIYWNSVTDADRYRIYRATSEEELALLSNSEFYTTTTNEYYIARASYTHDYYYAVKAYNDSDFEYSNISNTVSVNKVATPEITLSEEDGLTISWNTVANSPRYYIYRATTEAGLANLGYDSYTYSTTQTSYTLQNGFSSDYYYAIRAYDGSAPDYPYYEYTALSNAVSISKVATPEITLSEEDNLTITWTAVDNATSYYIYRATTEEGLSTASVYTTTTEATYTARKSYSSAYYYAIKAYDGSEYTDLSNAVQIEQGDGVAWENTTNDTYYFVEGENFVWSSNNQNISSSTATSTWTVTVSNDTTYTISYTVSSESGYDKLNITLDDSNIVSDKSGTVNDTYTTTLTSGTHTLTASYSKDSSSNYGTDTATITLEPISYE